MDHGRATAAGTANELKSLIGDQRVDVIAADSAGIETSSSRHSRPASTSRSSPEQRIVSIPAPNELEDLALVAAALKDIDVEIDEIALRRPTLDDAFLALTGQPRDDQTTENNDGSMDPQP